MLFIKSFQWSGSPADALQHHRYNKTKGGVRRTEGGRSEEGRRTEGGRSEGSALARVPFNLDQERGNLYCLSKRDRWELTLVRRDTL